MTSLSERAEIDRESNRCQSSEREGSKQDPIDTRDPPLARLYWGKYRSSVLSLIHIFLACSFRGRLAGTDSLPPYTDSSNDPASWSPGFEIASKEHWASADGPERFACPGRAAKIARIAHAIIKSGSTIGPSLRDRYQAIRMGREGATATL